MPTPSSFLNCLYCTSAVDFGLTRRSGCWRFALCAIKKNKKTTVIGTTEQLLFSRDSLTAHTHVCHMHSCPDVDPAAGRGSLASEDQRQRLVNSQGGGIFEHEHLTGVGAGNPASPYITGNSCERSEQEFKGKIKCEILEIHLST